jgi:glycosyltransferase involved in cell wall biosynthesis
MLNVIHLVLGKANPERMNGVNKVVHALATQQAQAGWAVQVWGITADPVVNYPPRVFVTRLFQAQRNPFQIDAGLLEAIDQLPPTTVVHLHGGFVPANYAVARQLVARGIAYVFTPHGSYNLIAMQRSRWTKQMYVRLFERRLLRHAACVHCLGQSEVVGTRYLMPAATTCLLPYGFGMPDLPTVPVEPTSRPFRVGFCGRLDAYTKGLDALLAGFTEFLKTVPQAELWLIGDGPDRAEVERLAALAPAGTVHLLGSRFGAEKLALLARLDLFAHPSRNEGLPTAVLEAAALGLPCLITEATNLGDYVRHFDCGEVIGATDATLVADALRHLHAGHSAASREQNREKGRRMVSTVFYWPALLEEYRQMYENALLAYA